jgi:hypothetical protein
MLAGLVVGALVGFAPSASAQDRLGGHFGVVLPLVTHVGGDTVTISDDFQIGFPMGITVKNPDWKKIAFDLELVPGIQNEPLGVGLTVHPGILYSLKAPWTFGVRMAFDVNAPSWGFTPLLNYGLPNGHGLFIEGVVPIRFQEDSLGDNRTAIGFGVHLGIGF